MFNTRGNERASNISNWNCKKIKSPENPNTKSWLSYIHPHFHPNHPFLHFYHPQIRPISNLSELNPSIEQSISIPQPTSSKCTRYFPKRDKLNFKVLNESFLPLYNPILQLSLMNYTQQWPSLSHDWRKSIEHGASKGRAFVLVRDK